MSVLLSLGSNIEPRRHLSALVRRLGERVEVVATSPVYETEPVGARDDAPIFLNAAVEILCAVSPAELKFDVLRPLERALGRVRTSDRNAPRTIDVDIALFGDRVVDEPASSIVIPDPDILRWAHVALPLADIAPRRRHPVSGQTLEQIATRFRDTPGVLRLGVELSRLHHGLD